MEKLFILENEAKKALFQWDLNQRFIVKDPLIIEAHYYVSAKEAPLRCAVFEENGLFLVNIPNILLQKAGNYRVYAYYSNSTVDVMQFEVLPRPKPDIYIYEETELVSVENMITDAIEKSNRHVLKMDIIDQQRLDLYKQAEQAGDPYYFSQKNWDKIIKENNRVYVEQYGDRGQTSMYTLRETAIPLRHAWYNQEDWKRRFEIEHPGEELRAPKNEEYPTIDSIAQRSGDGHLNVPEEPLELPHATSLSYVLKLAERVKALEAELYSGTEGLEYELIDGEYVCTGKGEATSMDIEIATYIDGIPVTRISKYAFEDVSLDSITLPVTLEKLDESAFSGAKIDFVYIRNLEKWAGAFPTDKYASPVSGATKVYINNSYIKNLIIPKTVTKITDRAFTNWVQLESVQLPEGCIGIKQLAFSGCKNIKTVTFPESIDWLEGGLFQHSNSQLSSVLFKGTPSSISSSAFNSCPNLKKIFVAWDENTVVDKAPWGASNATIYYYSETEPKGDKNYWHYVDGVPKVWVKPYVETEGLTYMLTDDGKGYICTGIGTATDKTIVIPDEYNGKSVMYIGINAFANADVETIILPRTMRAAYGGSLSSPSITKVVVRTYEEIYNYMGPEILAISGLGLYKDIMVGNYYASPFTPVELRKRDWDWDGENYYDYYLASIGQNTTIKELHVPWSKEHYANDYVRDAIKPEKFVYNSEESLR